MDRWSAYKQTVFVLGEGVAARALPDAFGIVTAWNPDGVVVSPEENDRADRALFTALVEAGSEPLRVTGCSPDRSHQEPGWLIACDLATAVAWGRRFRQEAVYGVAGDRLVLLACEPEHLPCDLGSFRTRIVAAFD